MIGDVVHFAVEVAVFIDFDSVQVDIDDRLVVISVPNDLLVIGAYIDS